MKRRVKLTVAYEGTNYLLGLGKVCKGIMQFLLDLHCILH